MTKEKMEIKKGVYARVLICPECEKISADQNRPEEINEQIFTRKTFKIGGSLAIRIPKELANNLGLEEGTDVNIDVKDKKIIIDRIT